MKQPKSKKTFPNKRSFSKNSKGKSKKRKQS